MESMNTTHEEAERELRASLDGLWEPALASAEDRLNGWLYRMSDEQKACLLIRLADGSLHILGATNSLGGTCDDCPADFDLKHIVAFKRLRGAT